MNPGRSGQRENRRTISTTFFSLIVLFAPWQNSLHAGQKAERMNAQRTSPLDEKPAQEAERMINWLLAKADVKSTGTGAGKVETPLSIGLPAAIAPGILKNGFVPFASIPQKEPLISNGGDIQFTPPGLSIGEVFEERTWARLPPKARIVRETSKDPELWHFPAGTRVAHEILLKTSPPTLFELRLMEKRADGTWAFGIYIPLEDGRTLALHRKESQMLSFRVPLPRRNVQVEMERLHPQSCRTCHFNHGVRANEYYADEEHVGPCGFVPDNAAILKEWAPAYQKKHGYWPFEAAHQHLKNDE